MGVYRSMPIQTNAMNHAHPDCQLSLSSSTGGVPSRVAISQANRHPGHSRQRFRVVTLAAVILWLPSSCKMNPGPDIEPASRFDRLVAAYPELRAGRFALLADFETPSHFELFSAREESQILSTRSKRSTHGEALQWSIKSGSDALEISNDHAANWYLKRDWSEYDLLLFSIDGPRGDLRLRIEISGGESPHTATAQTNWTLFKGRNVVRLDLAELAERLPLDDIREIRLSIPNADGSTGLVLDDFILTQDREVVLGDRSSTDGSLYVVRKGRRWHVGAGGRFELVFGHGQIIAWYDAAFDPQRLNNLIAGTVLAPEWADGKTPGEVAAGVSVIPASTRMELIEANPVRVVVAAERRLSGDAASQSRFARITQWRYTVYPTGHIFVGLKESGPDTKSAGTSIRLTLPNRSERSLVALESAEPGRGGSAPDQSRGSAAVQVALGDAGRAIVFAPYMGPGGLSFAKEPAGDGMMTLTARPRYPAASDLRCAAILLHLIGAEGRNESQPPDAESFHQPVGITPLIGSAVANGEPCAFQSGGFDRTRGAYQMAPDGNLLRFVLPGADGTDRTRVYHFEVAAPDRATAWVYRGHLLHQPTARSAEGQLIFAIPAEPSTDRTIEVHLTKP